MTRRRALVVDDEPLMAEFIAEVFEDIGFDCTALCDASEAVAQLRMQKPDVVVLDLIMPGMDGIEVIRHIADAGLHQSQLFLISGYDKALLNSAEQVARERQLHVAGVLTKPLRLDYLIEQFQDLQPAASLPFREISDAQMEAEFPIAAHNRLLHLNYQPQVSFADGCLVGVEALARWNHPTFGNVPADAFVPYAERHGLVTALTDQVLETALSDLCNWRAAGLDIKLSVNVSPAYMVDLTLPERLESHVRELSLEPNDINIELTETAVSQDLADAMDILTRLRLRGFGLSLDDFGTGHSTLIQLHRIPFTELKIDKSFVAHAPSGADERAIIESVVLLADRLGMTSVAEGVENVAHYEVMRDMGCDVGQGYYMARPMTAEQLSQWACEYKATGALPA